MKILIVDDGSGEDQQAWLKLWVEDLRRRFPLILPPLCNPENQGKGGAVYSGWQTADETFDWLAFVDADGAISPEEVVRVLKTIPETNTSAIWAVRTGEQGTLVRRVFKRKLSGSVFRALVKKLFEFPVPDTQCGYKLVKADHFRKIESNLEERRYCFDIELTFRLLQSGERIESVPINWDESPGSRLGSKSIWSMLTSVISMKRRLGRWQD